MPNKSIPQVGEQFIGRNPGKEQWIHVTYGPDTTADVLVTDCGTHKLVEVNEGVILTGGYSMIETAFTASVTVDLGDSADVDRLHASGTVASTTAGTVFVASTMAVPFNDTTGNDINATVAGATPAAGLGHLWLKYVVLND